MSNSRPANIPELTGVRGLAALWVWLYHAFFLSGSQPVLAEALGLRLTPLLSVGWIGVDMFFVLSGFVLFWPYAGRDARPFSFPEFMRKRALRVLPAYYLQFMLLLAVAASGLVWDLPSWQNTLAHVLMLHNLNEYWASAINGPWWTLPVEWQFYLVFPALILLLARFGAWRALLAAVLLALAWRYGSYHLLQLRETQPAGGTILFWMGQFPGYLSEFFCGMAAAWLAARLWPRMGDAGWRARLSTWLFITSVILLIGWIYLLDLNSQVYWQGHWLLFVWNIGAGFILAVFIFSLALGGGMVRRLFANRPMLWLGEISYSLYLWHFVVLGVMVHFGLFGAASPEARLLHIMLYGAVPVLLVSWLSWWLTERPFLQYRKENATNRLHGTIGRVVHQPWPVAAVAAVMLVAGTVLAVSYQRPANEALASCTQRGAVDMPLRLGATEGAVHVAGWAYDWDPRNRIRRIVLSSGGVDFAEAPIAQQRPDVVAALRGCRVGSPGFEMRLDQARIPSRSDPVIVHAERGDGARFEIGRIPWL